METTQKKVKPAGYKWWKDKKMVGTIILISSIILLIFSFVKVPVISSINGYTIGMLLGFYSPLFYFYFIYKSLIMIFGDKITTPTWIKLTNTTYWFVVISIVFISTSMGYYQSKNGFTNIGSKPWDSFNTWWDKFTDGERVSAWTPNNTNGGLIGVFMYSFVAMIASGIGAIILSITMLIISASLLITGTAIGLYKDLAKRKKLDLRDKEIKENKDSNIKQFESEIDELKVEPRKEVKEKIDSLPFDDPF